MAPGRDATYAQAEAWPERYDIILQRQLRAGEITGDEFSRRWYELWGVSAEEVPRLQQIDQLMTAVSEFDSELRVGPTALDEAGLRSEIERIISSVL